MADKGKQKILIVDDESIVRHAVKRIMSTLPYELIEASCGQEAIQILQADIKQHSIALVCLDWLMPNGSGRDVLQWKKRAGHRASVLIMTAYGSNQINEEIRGFDVDDVMTKPFENITDVRQRVSTLL